MRQLWGERAVLKGAAKKKDGATVNKLKEAGASRVRIIFDEKF